MPVVPIFWGIVALFGAGAVAKVSGDTEEIAASVAKAAPWVAAAVIGVVILKGRR